MEIPQDRYVDVKTIRTCYWEEGEGLPLILLHGMGGSAAGYLPCFGKLIASHRVIAPELIGHGLTGGSASELESANDLAQFVIDFMDSMKIDKAIIMGHSMGAVIALTLIINFPERVSKLIIADSSGLGREITPIFRFLTLPLFGEMLYKMTFKEDMKSFAENKRNTSQNPAAISDELIKQLYLRENRKDQYRTTLKFLRKICNWFGQKREFTRPIIEGLPNIDIPVLVVWGDKDDIVPWQHGEYAAGIIPNARLEVINNCGHVPMFDQPDELNRLLLDFLNE